MTQPGLFSLRLGGLGPHASGGVPVCPSMSCRRPRLRVHTLQHRSQTRGARVEGGCGRPGVLPADDKQSSLLCMWRCLPCPHSVLKSEDLCTHRSVPGFPTGVTDALLCTHTRLPPVSGSRMTSSRLDGAAGICEPSSDGTQCCPPLGQCEVRRFLTMYHKVCSVLCCNQSPLNQQCTRVSRSVSGPPPQLPLALHSLLQLGSV